MTNASASADYTIKKLEASEFDLLLPLMKDAFDITVDVDYFKWKFLDNPAGPFVGFVAVHSSGEIGAYYGVIPERYTIQGVERTIYQSCDTMTHSRHRRRGLFQMLAVHCYEYLRAQGKLFVIGFGGPQSTPGFLKFGWREVARFRTFFIPRFFCRLGARHSSRVEVAGSLADIATLLEHKGPEPIRSIRDLQTVRWRLSNPRYNYQIQVHREGANATGYICYYWDGAKIFLFDFYFPNGRVRRAMLGWLKREALRDGGKGIVAWGKEGGEVTRHLTAGGFISNPFSRGPLHEKRPFIFFADEATMNKFSTSDSWHLESFDHDAL